MSIVLSFKDNGPAFDRANTVAQSMGLSMEEYLLACIAEGHKLLRNRHHPNDSDLEEPTFQRWGIDLLEPGPTA